MKRKLFGLTIRSLPHFPPQLLLILSVPETAAMVHVLESSSVEKDLVVLFLGGNSDKKELFSKSDFAPLLPFPSSFESIQGRGLKSPGTF